ncbi:MAG: hypothetical protein WC322_06275 [Candidatus Paceibacterota bacterium]|jgi:hypothetical protein
MAITIRDVYTVGRNLLPANTGVVEGHRFSLYATLAAELTGAALVTANGGNITCMVGSEAITKAGEILQLDSDGVWYQIV